jgi:ubiquinone/menaquinone biosynthesis C-methylase UbiE
LPHSDIRRIDLIKQIKEFIDSQYSQPRGLWGMYFGEKMVKQHQPETLWTIKLLKIQQDEKILELGCGAGYAMKLLLKQSVVRQVVGLDISQTMLRSAAIRNRNEVNSGRASLVLGKVNQLAFKDESFTKVFSIQSVYFWDKLHETISEIYRVLKPEGTVIITLSDGKDGETWNDIRTMLEQQLIPAMQQNGFKNIELVRGPNSRQYDTISVKGDK